MDRQQLELPHFVQAGPFLDDPRLDLQHWLGGFFLKSHATYSLRGSLRSPCNLEFAGEFAQLA